ncbi:dephospho-CoA kinase [Vibrio sinensis]|uniref:Dephospho-CoA kinase n=1 Tax=Vibrio sinensis TaxID=2302434 RepID=A0A3A6QFF3_9VIBR|nr:dephospho-CoA kinase [Vibrio sinensis]RJX67374.1 dephospho-CoA kinase [Vibrio sinensis]
MTLVIGITGGIASGKTTVANLFNEHFGIEIVDADIVARQVVEPGSKGLTAITERYGDHILTDNGELDRPALRQIIFSNDNEKSWLNSLLHPLIRSKMLSDLDKVTSEYALLVIPLMVENGLQELADRILVVDVDEQTQKQRTMTRDKVSEQQVESIIASQATRQQRLAIADDVVKNHAENQRLLPQITDLHKKYLDICRNNL